MEKRKEDHINLAAGARISPELRDKRFYYEPLFNAHPSGDVETFEFLGKKMRRPLWVSSMTGGSKISGLINRNLARACREFGLGMGLGSCRVLLNGDEHFEDFNLRPVLGEECPFFANLGITQVEGLIRQKKTVEIRNLIGRLGADGLIIHLNPIQEWIQPEGDKLEMPPLETLTGILEEADYPVIVKEVGQGLGPQSLAALLKLPVAAIEFAAYGGTNFTQIELMRGGRVEMEYNQPLAYIGHTAEEMTDFVNNLAGADEDLKCRQLIISGGIDNFLDGYYLINRSILPAVYGQAGELLKYAKGDYQELHTYIYHQVNGLKFAKNYLRLKDE